MIQFIMDQEGQIRRLVWHLPGWIIPVITPLPGLPKKKPSKRRNKKKPTSHYQRYRNDVLTRDHWKCCKCGGEFGKVRLTVHHLLNYAEYPDLQLDPDNGITLCLTCHCTFHDIYGSFNNNAGQIKEYLIKGTSV